MRTSSDGFTDVIEAWLDAAPAYEDAESVLARIVAQVNDTPQHGPAWGWWGRLDSSMVVGVGLGAAATILIALIGGQLLGGAGQGGGGPAPTEPPASPIPSPSPTVPPASPSYALPGCSPDAFGSAAGSTPTEDMRGLIGLPADGATPSAPEQGELLDCWPVDGGRVPYRGMVRLYADGRLIWNYYNNAETLDPLDDGTTGHIEQRLTTAGVDLVMGEDDIGARDPLRLGEWLPASAWEDQTMRPYIPSGYGACLFVRDDGRPPPKDLILPLAEKLAMLPPEVADLLNEKALVPMGAYDETVHCLGLTLAEARLLDGELSRLRFAQDEQLNQYLLGYKMDLDGDGPGAELIQIWFEPIFPDGSIGCSACG